MIFKLLFLKYLKQKLTFLGNKNPFSGKQEKPPPHKSPKHLHLLRRVCNPEWKKGPKFMSTREMA
jgi:hypothetical protein